MSTQKQRRRAKKIEKQRKKRAVAQRSRGSRKPAGGAELGEVLSWPVGECWVGERWHERGARVPAAFTRRRDDGQVAAALFEVDLAEGGVVRAEVKLGVTDQAVQAELGRWSEDQAVIAAEPELVVRLVEAGRRHGLAQGHAQAPAVAEAAALFEGVSGEDAPFEILCGTEEAPAEAPPQAPGILARWKRRLGLGS